MEPNQYVAPAACIQTFLKSAGGVRLSTHKRWVEAYQAYKELSAILSFVENPGTISQRSLEAAKINTNYRQALLQSNLKLDNGILYYHEPIVGLESYAKLQDVPAAFRNIVFIAFHSNPLGGHFNAARTFHHIHLRFYWPHMFTYIQRMCHSCPWCALTNPIQSKSRKLIYNFPIKALLWSSTSTDIKQGESQVSRGHPTILLLAVGCAHLL
jgi:hypothetical protein